MAKAKHGTGLYNKYYVVRMDGESAPGRKHCGCEYFVLDLDCDPHALPALLAYAESCKETHPGLSSDLKRAALRLKRGY